MQEVDYQSESAAYYRLGEVETELATAKRMITELELESKTWQDRARWLIRVLLATLCVLLVCAILMIVAGVYFLTHK